MSDFRVYAGDAQEDQITGAIEARTAQIPSSVFLGAAFASIAGSLILQFSRRRHEALFVGQWVAPFLILGIYNKLVKQHGSDATSRDAEPRV